MVGDHNMEGGLGQFREHHFILATAKHVFSHSEYGIVFVRDPATLKDLEFYGLESLLLYGLSVPGTSLRWVKLCPFDDPASIANTLDEAWRQADGLRGRPDTLTVSRHVAGTAANNLVETLAATGVRLTIAAGNDKAFSAATRRCQEDAMWLGLRTPNHQQLTVDQLNRVATSNHNKSFQMKMERPSARLEEWRALQQRPVNLPLVEAIDWEPGPWLTAWEKAVAPIGRRYFHESTLGGGVWLFSTPPITASDDSIDATSTEPETDDLSECAQILVKCWPNSPGDIARSIGTTARSLQWFLDGKAALDYSQRDKLCELFGLQPNAQFYTYEPHAPLVLIAKTLKSATSAYDFLSHGGDLAFSVEALPHGGEADPSWRYLLFQPYQGPLNAMLVPRGSSAGQALSGKHFINFEGAENFPPELYRTLVRTCAKSCRYPQSNVLEMRRFEEKYLDDIVNSIGR